MAVKNRLYPHLLQPDIELWEDFLEGHSDNYTHFDYDVRVGEGRDPGPDYSDKIRQMGIDLSQRRIDVVGHRADHIDIIEISVYAGIKAIGQLMVYPQLYQDTFHPSLTLQPILICREISSDVAPYTVEFGIRTYHFPGSVK